MTPARIRLQRTAGWRKPPEAIVVARPTRWGNPFRWQAHDRAWAVRAHRRWLAGAGPDTWHINGRQYSRSRVLEDLHQLTGHPLCCWCPDEAPCHATTLIELVEETRR